jgi:hypothetical protein
MYMRVCVCVRMSPRGGGGGCGLHYLPCKTNCNGSFYNESLQLVLQVIGEYIQSAINIALPLRNICEISYCTVF